MTLFILNTDKRLIFLHKKLMSKNCYNLPNKMVLATFDEIILNAKTLDTIILPPNFKWTIDQANTLPNNVNLVCGNANNVVEIFNKKNIKYFNLMQDETFVLKNAILTAEGFLPDLVANTPTSIYEQKIIILGGGRVAKSLALLFLKLGVSFDITMRNDEKLLNAMLYASSIINWNSFKTKLKNYDTIINTIPSKIFEKSNIKEFKDEAVIFELSSTKCIDEKILEEIKIEENSPNINFVFSPGLPGKYLPKTAGDLIFEFLQKNFF